RGAPSYVAQRAMFFCLSGFSSGSCTAREGSWRNAQSCEVQGGFDSSCCATCRVTCAARRAVLFRAFLLLVPALRAG
ncbi:hypothetical protein A2U01_0094316, partial [Trifolium medium]|nr:hypothetical protein [Trifolium medium]